MKVFISEADKQNAKRIALVNIAKFYNIPDWEFDDNDKLEKKVLAWPNNTLVTPLQEYFDAYDAWFKFYMDIKEKEEKSKEEHELDPQEKEKLAGLIQKRQATLDNLQKKFDQEQFEKFKKINGLEGVQGIDLSE